MKKLTILLSVSLLAGSSLTLGGCAVASAGVKKGDERNFARSLNDVNATRAIKARMGRIEGFKLGGVDTDTDIMVLRAEQYRSSADYARFGVEILLMVFMLRQGLDGIRRPLWQDNIQSSSAGQSRVYLPALALLAGVEVLRNRSSSASGTTS